jgi:hypothetical protein
MDAYQTWLIVLVTLVMGWFGIGVIGNIRRGNATLKWMQGGLPMLGEKTTLRWLGSSAVHLVISKAKPPFRRVELVIVMEPRDVPWLWLWNHLHGRRDMMILRGLLMTAPRLEYDLVAPESWSGRSALSEAAERRWGAESVGAHRFLAPSASLPVSNKDASLLLEYAQKIDPVIWRLGVRREYPQLEVHFPLPRPKHSDARQFIESLRTVGEQTARVNTD